MKSLSEIVTAIQKYVQEHETELGWLREAVRVSQAGRDKAMAEVKQLKARVAELEDRLAGERSKARQTFRNLMFANASRAADAKKWAGFADEAMGRWDSLESEVEQLKEAKKHLEGHAHGECNEPCAYCDICCVA